MEVFLKLLGFVFLIFFELGLVGYVILAAIFSILAVKKERTYSSYASLIAFFTAVAVFLSAQVIDVIDSVMIYILFMVLFFAPLLSIKKHRETYPKMANILLIFAAMLILGLGWAFYKIFTTTFAF